MFPSAPREPTGWQFARVCAVILAVMALVLIAKEATSQDTTAAATDAGPAVYTAVIPGRPVTLDYGDVYSPGESIFVAISRPVCPKPGSCEARVTITNHSDRYPYQLDYHKVSTPTQEATTSGLWLYPLWPGREWSYDVFFTGAPDTPLTFTPAFATQVSLPKTLDMDTEVTWK